jgi:MYXO-CTERM domain-containing protein
VLREFEAFNKKLSANPNLLQAPSKLEPAGQELVECDFGCPLFEEKRMLNRTLFFAGAACLTLGISASASAVDIARWNFTATVAPNDNNPVATTNLTTASAAAIGMSGFTNANGLNTTATCDVLSTPTNPNPLSTNFAWRVRGDLNGWALSAPQYAQGAEFDVSTVGFQGVSLSFDFFSTTQGVKDLQVQYNADVTSSAGWTNFTGSVAGVATVKDASNNTLLVATSNNYNTVGTTVTTNTIDLSGIAGINNDSHFGVRLVSAFDPTVTPLTYSGAAGGTYNNSSGNWRFDQIAIKGTAVPEVPTSAVLGLATLGLLVARRRRSA